MGCNSFGPCATPLTARRVICPQWLPVLAQLPDSGRAPRGPQRFLPGQTATITSRSKKNEIERYGPTMTTRTSTTARGMACRRGLSPTYRTQAAVASPLWPRGHLIWRRKGSTGVVATWIGRCTRRGDFIGANGGRALIVDWTGCFERRPILALENTY